MGERPKKMKNLGTTRQYEQPNRTNDQPSQKKQKKAIARGLCFAEAALKNNIFTLIAWQLDQAANAAGCTCPLPLPAIAAAACIVWYKKRPQGSPPPPENTWGCDSKELRAFLAPSQGCLGDLSSKDLSLLPLQDSWKKNDKESLSSSFFCVRLLDFRVS